LENEESIIKLFSNHGTLIQPDTLDYILNNENPDEFSKLLTNNMKEYPLILTLDRVKEIEQKNKEPKVIQPSKETLIEKKLQTAILSKLHDDNQITIPNEENELEDVEDEKEIIPIINSIDKKERIKQIKSPSSWNPISKEYDSDVKILKDITGQSTCEGLTDDFTKLFSDRFDILRKLLRNKRRELAQVIPINRIKKSGLNNIQAIGIINEIRTTQNGHRLFEIEDDTGSITAIILKNQREIFQAGLEIVSDEIIGISGQLSKNGDLFVVNNVIYPDISLNNTKHKSDIQIYAAFLSDIHIGSREFMEKQWMSFLTWINGDLGNTRQKNVASKIKYIVIPGDAVDGIGIYPGQEKELSIIDLYKQYEALADHLSSIPDHISVIIQPGNHDAVRPAEPQPTFEKEIQQLFNSNETHFIGNPSYYSLNTVEILSYHGQSLLDFATNIQHLKYNEPVEIMKKMLQKHHLAPVYGGYTPIAPEHADYMIIDKIPDIFVTGHVHLATLGEYRGVTLINASSWQAQTSYQKMLNFIPDPAKLPIADLSTGKVTMMDFNKQ
jgi:DNA polymerase II small subunit